MDETPVGQVLADNLRHFMAHGKKGPMTQQQLAAASGIGQTTISLYLRPQGRKDTASGREPSPTLANVEALAKALDVELWELLRPLSQAQRDLLRSLEEVAAAHLRNLAAGPPSREELPAPDRVVSRPAYPVSGLRRTSTLRAPRREPQRQPDVPPSSADHRPPKKGK